MNEQSYEYMKALVERVKHPLMNQLDEREQILLDSYYIFFMEEIWLK